MEVIKFLQGLSMQKGLNKLKEEFGINHSINDDYPELVVLNYDQIKSPKAHDIVRECRSLVLAHEKDLWYPVSRSFDRFYNYGECGVEPDILQCSVMEKMDGSIIGLFNWKGKWLYRTRSVIMPVSNINGMEETWDKFIEEALGDYWKSDILHRDYTYIMEVVGPDNRIVVRYPRREMVLLSIRDNMFGHYSTALYCDKVAAKLGYRRPREYPLTDIESCMTAAKNLPNLEEGYVLYDNNNAPCAKIKNPAYVAAHHLRGDGALTPRRIMDLLIINEIDEYLNVFPEEEPRLNPYVKAFKEMFDDVKYQWGRYSGIEDQKEFAIKVSKLKCSTFLFNLRKGVSLEDTFAKMTTQGKYRNIQNYVD